MKNICVAFFISLMMLQACNQGARKTNETIKDSITQSSIDNAEEIGDISEVLTRFVRAYASRDQAKINSLLHPELGLTVIYRSGVSDNFTTVDSMDFAHPVPNYYPYPTLDNPYALTFDTLPVFDCGTGEWNKEGFICDTTGHPTQLTRIALFENEFNEATYSPATLEQIANREKLSFRVIVTTKNPLIFHVQKFQGQWYVTVLDRAYSGCDA